MCLFSGKVTVVLFCTLVLCFCFSCNGLCALVGRSSTYKNTLLVVVVVVVEVVVVVVVIVIIISIIIIIIKVLITTT